MLMQEATPKMREEWIAVWNEYKDMLRPNRKNGAEVVVYLKGRYALKEIHEKKLLHVIAENALHSPYLKEEIKRGQAPSPVAFTVENTGSGKALYDNQDGIFRGMKIFVGVDLTTGLFHVEGSSMLWDELYAYQGLDEKAIQNPYCVYEYISCLKRFGLLDQVISCFPGERREP